MKKFSFQVTERQSIESLREKVIQFLTENNNARMAQTTKEKEYISEIIKLNSLLKEVENQLGEVSDFPTFNKHFISFE